MQVGRRRKSANTEREPRRFHEEHQGAALGALSSSIMETGSAASRRGALPPVRPAIRPRETSRPTATAAAQRIIKARSALPRGTQLRGEAAAPPSRQSPGQVGRRERRRSVDQRTNPPRPVRAVTSELDVSIESTPIRN